MKPVSQSYPVSSRLRDGVRTRARQDNPAAWDKEYRILSASHRWLNRVIGPFASPVQEVWRAFIDQNHRSPDMPEVLAGSRT